MSTTPRKINDGFKHQMERDAIRAFVNRCFSVASIASGVVSTNVTLAAAIQVCIEGYMYTVAAVTSGITSQTAQASNTVCLYMVTVNSQSVMTVKGPDCSAGSTVWFNTAIPVSQCPVGMIKVSLASTVSWQMGKDAFGSGASLVSCTVEYYNIGMVPEGVMLSDV